MKAEKTILYFVDGCKEQTKAAILETEAASIVSDLSAREFQDLAAFGNLASGPNGSPGLLFAINAEGRTCDDFGYFPDRQKWVRTSERVSVGIPDGLVVTPESLQRLHPVATDKIATAFKDGSVWEVPVLRDPTFESAEYGWVYDSNPEFHETGLPTCHFQTFKDGKAEWTRKVDEEYQRLFDLSRQWFTWLHDGCLDEGQPAATNADVYQYCVDVMSLRYRYTMHHHNAFQDKFLNSAIVNKIISISCGWELAMACIEKKNRQLDVLSISDSGATG